MGRGYSIRQRLTQCERLPTMGPRFAWHRLVFAQGADDGIALETDVAVVEFTGRYQVAPYWERVGNHRITYVVPMCFPRRRVTALLQSRGRS